MGELFKMVQAIDGVILESGQDPFAVKGEIGMKAGFFLVIVQEDTPDDPNRVVALRQAAREVLGRTI